MIPPLGGDPYLDVFQPPLRTFTGQDASNYADDSQTRRGIE